MLYDRHFKYFIFSPDTEIMKNGYIIKVPNFQRTGLRILGIKGKVSQGGLQVDGRIVVDTVEINGSTHLEFWGWSAKLTTIQKLVLSLIFKTLENEKLEGVCKIE